MPKLTPAQRAKLEEVQRWYDDVYIPWWQTYGRDFGEFQQWKARRLESWRFPWARSDPSALWPPRSQP